MTPLLPDGGPLPVTRARVMIQHEWPTVQQEIDSGHPSPLGLIRVKSLDINDIGKNHQVLAYGYSLAGTQLSLAIYDPNFPNRDDLTLAIDVGNAASEAPATYSTGEDVFCFFHTPYTPPAAAPP
jgi:hypothetical protein